MIESDITSGVYMVIVYMLTCTILYVFFCVNCVLLINIVIVYFAVHVM